MSEIKAHRLRNKFYFKELVCQYFFEISIIKIMKSLVNGLLGYKSWNLMIRRFKEALAIIDFFKLCLSYVIFAINNSEYQKRINEQDTPLVKMKIYLFTRKMI
jgi:hypothetical protein